MSPGKGQAINLDDLYFGSHSIENALVGFDSASFVNKASDVYKEVAADISSGFKGKIHPKLYELYNASYNKGLAKFGNPKEGDPYYEILQKFKDNVARFAAYKSYHVTRELKSLPKEDYENESKQLLKKYSRYQAVEYNAVVSRSRTAKQWIQFKDEAEEYPNLEWMMTRSADPREEHLELVGTVLPMDDPFWDDNQPGNLYGCKCDWQTTDKEPTGGSRKSISPSKGLEGNPAQTGELITDSHPYINNNPIKAVERYIEEEE